MKYRPKHVAEYVFLRCVCGVVGRLPYRLALSVGWGLAGLLWAGMGQRRREARRRIRGALGEEACTVDRARRIAWAAWRNLIFSGVDILRLPHTTERWIRRVVDHRGAEELRARLEAAGKIILAVPHMGSWELAGMALHFFGLRLSLIMRRQKNPLTDAWLNRLRTDSGAECIERDTQALRTALRHIKQGRVLTILPDIRAREGGFQVRFLGGHASVMKGMALFAKLSGAPILPACVRREGWTRHRWQVFSPVWPDAALDREADIQRMTQQVFDLFDRLVREHPEQYFWFNKRWILDPFEPAAAAPAEE